MTHTRIPSLAIIMMGVAGSGKSTVGTRLAEGLGLTYLEGDAFHLERSIEKMARGLALEDDDRWPWLDRLAEEVAREVALRGGVVASCSALKRAYRDRLRKAINGHVVFIHLNAGQSQLKERIKARENHYMPPSLLQSQLQLLEPLESDEISLILTNDETIEAAVAEALAWASSLLAHRTP